MTTTTLDPLHAALDKDQVRATYGWQARFYNAWAAFTESKARAVALEKAQLVDGTDLLEVATGTGLLFAELLPRNPSGKNEGIDLTPEMLARARRAAARTGVAHRLQVGDAYALPFDDASFDLVMNSYMFDLLPEADFPRVLSEMRRVLRPGGRLVLTNLAAHDNAFMRAWNAVYRARPSLVGGCRGVLLEVPLVEAGFEVEERVVLTQLGFPSEIIRARKPDEVRHD